MISEDSQAEKSAQLLSQANLNRLRQEWDEAITSSMQVLYGDPENWRAHALLGDIYADQNRPDEAIRWYCMTLDIHPDSHSTREKLNKLITSRRQEFVESLDPTRPLVNREGKAYTKNAFGMISWQMSAPERKKRLITAIAVLTILLVVIAIPILNGRGQLGTKGAIFTPGSAPTASTLFLQPASQAGIGQNPTSQAISASTQSVSTAAADTAQASGSTQNTATSTADTAHDSDEASLISELNSDTAITSSGTHVVDTEINPLTNTLSVTYTCDPASGTITPERIMHSGLTVAREALGQPDATSMQTCVVRCLTPGADEQASSASIGVPPDSSPTLAFVATIGRSTLATVPTEDKITDDQVTQAFSNIWWSQTSTSSATPVAQSSPTP